MGGGINTNMNLVGKLSAFYRTRTYFTYKPASNEQVSRYFASMSTTSEHILPIRKLHIEELVGILPACLPQQDSFHL